MRSRKMGLSTTLLISVLSIIATASLAWPPVANALIADGDAIAHYQLWRLLSGPLVHATWGHLARDLALLLFVGVAIERELGRGYPLLCLLGLAVPTVVSLGHPQIDVYFGTSGLTHALLAAMICHVLWSSRSEVRTPHWMLALAALGGLALFAKVIWELTTGVPVFPMDLGPGIRQVPIAHATGAAIGALFIGLARVNPSVRRGGWSRASLSRPVP